MQHQSPTHKIAQNEKKAAANEVLVAGVETGPTSPRTQEAIAKFMFEHRGNFRLWKQMMVKQASESKLVGGSPKSLAPAKK